MGFKDLEFLKVGSMVLLDAKVESELKPYFFIKASKENIVKIGNSPMVNSKAVVFKTDQNYTMLLVMFRFNEDDELIYMKWFNYYEKYKREKLDKLIYSDKLFFCIIDDENNKQATFECNNAIRFIIKQCSEETKGKWWSNGEFWGYAKNISSKYAHRAELFNSKF